VSAAAGQDIEKNPHYSVHRLTAVGFVPLTSREDQLQGADRW
jgi:hypothetical protein